MSGKFLDEETLVPVHDEGLRQAHSSGQNCEPPCGGASLAPALNILVAEDEPIMRTLMKVIFRQSPHQVVFVASGLEAVSAWEEGAFDLILMDEQMPEMCGMEAVRRIRELEQVRSLPRVPVIALTAHNLPEYREKCLAAGMDGYLAKPIDLQELFVLLETCWKARGKRGEG